MLGLKRANFTWAKRGLGENSLKGLKVAIIGGTNGIGQGISRELVSKGATAVVVGRTFRDQNNPSISFIQSDLSLMEKSISVARALPVEEIDLFLFTVGILPTSTRQETPEGIETDMAASYLNRFVMLQEIVPRLGKPRTGSFAAANFSRPRIFVMGFPGVSHAPNTNDFNSAKSYSLQDAHMNTVVGNEALVLHYAQAASNVDVFGLNPGMIKTDIRSPVLGKGLLFNAVEGLMSWFNPSVEQYAANLAPLLVSPDLNNRSGLMFNQKTEAILPNDKLTPAAVADVRKASQSLVDQSSCQQK
jgi:NAD(P)-dependent dehydrogenase (short-subunit alcohol dehydrogenase family)